MKRFFAPNIGRKGRPVRGLFGVLLLVSGDMALRWSRAAALIIFASAVFALFEALRGWCVMRACGIKTGL